MEQYLSKTLAALKQKLLTLPNLTIVLGNESGDLDSAVSAIGLAFHRHGRDGNNVVPVFNFSREDLELRTEVLQAFVEMEKLTLDNVVCLDEVDGKLKALAAANVRVILVDHNVISSPEMAAVLEERVTEVYDHRPKERTDVAKLSVCEIEPVGSCSTIIARKIFAEAPDVKDPHLLRLLRNTILLDTKNLDPEEKKVTPTDLEILKKVENKLSDLNFKLDDRNAVYKSLHRAKVGVDDFTVSMLIRKDMKILHLAGGGKLSISTIPKFSCKELSQRKEFQTEVANFTKNFKVIVLLGQGDLLVSNANPDLSNSIKKKFAEEKQWGIVFQSEKLSCDFYSRTEQGVTRKQILPLVLAAVS